MEETLSSKLRSLYMKASPEERARLHRETPTETRQGLEALAEQDREAFATAAPQIIDPQTHLYNKEHFENHILPSRIKDAAGKGAPLSYILFDLDNFHQFNGNHGHDSGDMAIDLFTKLIGREVRYFERRKSSESDVGGRRKGTDRRKYEWGQDVVARIKRKGYGGRVGKGEEFGVILYNCNGETALNIAGRILTHLQGIGVPSDGTMIPFSASAGVSQYKAGMSA